MYRPSLYQSDSEYFEVEYCIFVDHPERRDSTFMRRDVHRTVSHERFKTQGAAVRFQQGLLAGESDFSSEFICWVQVYHHRPNKRARCVRKRVDRERPGRWVYDLTPSPEGTSGWSLTDGTPFLLCETCRLTLHEGFPCKHVDQDELDAWLALGRAA